MCDAHAYASSSVLGGGGKDTTPDSSRGIGMTLGVGGGRAQGVVERGPPPTHTSTALRVSGPTPGRVPTRGTHRGEGIGHPAPPLGMDSGSGRPE